MQYQEKIQSLSQLRNELYEEAGKVSISNPEQAKNLWAAADLLVKAMDEIEAAEPAYVRPEFDGDLLKELLG